MGGRASVALLYKESLCVDEFHVLRIAGAFQGCYGRPFFPLGC